MDFIDDLDVSIIANILVNMGIDISNLNDITDADDYEDTMKNWWISILKWLDFTKEPRICTMIGKPINFRPSTPKVHIISTQRFQ